MTTEQPTAQNQAETCPECGWGLAADQRYCLNCGWRRGGARVDYETQVMRAGQPVTAAGPAAGPAQQWTPAFAILAIALLGVMLLLGVLIGKKGDEGTQTVAAAAPATTTAPTAATDTTATTADKSAKAGKDAGGTAPGEGNVVQGGSGSTQGIATADTGKSVQENAKSGPDVVATQGAPEKLDPSGPAGDGSDATCIGC